MTGVVGRFGRLRLPRLTARNDVGLREGQPLPYDRARLKLCYAVGIADGRGNPSPTIGARLKEMKRKHCQILHFVQNER